MKQTFYIYQGISEIWFKGDKNNLHRLDGPAVRFINGDKKIYYWIENERYDNFIEYIKAVIKYKSNQNV